ncbi:MAG: hypothetical protein Q9166_000668 [cf. Caloplaca sp. 2 TL-2023]
MFATLAVILPSEYEGAAVVTTHCGRPKSSSSVQVSTIPMFPDVTHEVQPVTSGYRIALVYNMVNTSAAHAHASLAIEQKKELSKILPGWNKAINESMDVLEALLYKLDHKYTDANLKHSRTQRVGQCQGGVPAGDVR